MMQRINEILPGVLDQVASKYEVRIVIGGEAVPMQRPRSRSWFSKDGRSGSSTYTPPKYAHWRDQARYAAQCQMDGRQLLDGPLEMSVLVVRPIPESWSQKKREQAMRGYILPDNRPDLDHFIAGGMDACSGIVFRDDAQVVRFVDCWKVYGAKPQMEIVLRPIVNALPPSS